MESSVANWIIEEAQKKQVKTCLVKMTEGISNFQIRKAFENINDTGIDDNFVGVFPANRMNRFMNYKFIISETKGKYLFMIANTDSSDKGETYWQNISEIYPKTDLSFFDSFGVDGLKSFIIEDDKKVIKKLLFGTEKMTRTDSKMILVNIKFNLKACKNLSKKELDNLSDAARNFFNFIQSFGNKIKLRDFVNIWMMEDRIKDLDSITCGTFQIYFYDNLFNPDKKNKIQNKARLNKNTTEILLNELFALDDTE